MFKRTVLFLATNLAVLLLLGLVLRVLDTSGILPMASLPIRPSSLLLYAGVFGFAGSFISLALSKWTAKFFMGAKVIDAPRQEIEHWLLAIVRDLATRSGIGMPEVAIYESSDMNAFATGPSRNRALVAVSTGLLERMHPTEIEAVLAHEITHVANGDMLTLALIQGVLNTFVIFASRLIAFAADRALGRSRDRDRDRGPVFWLTAMAAEMVLGIFATLIVLAFSRRREFRADAGSAALVGAPRMIAALERLKEARTGTSLPDSLRAFGIRSDERPGRILRLFSSHPLLDDRIDALRLASSRPTPRQRRAGEGTHELRPSAG